MLLNADAFLEQALEPDRMTIPEASLWWVFALALLVAIAGCAGILSIIRRAGPVGGGIALPEFAKGIALSIALFVLMATFTATEDISPLVSGLAQAAVALACIVALALDPWRAPEEPRPSVWFRAKPRHMLLVPPLWALAFPVLLAAMFAAVALAQILGMPVTQQGPIEWLRSNDSPLWIAGWYVMAAVAAPLWEEFVFRLVLFGGLCRALRGGESWLHPGTLAALFFSGGLFVLAHGVTEWTVGIIPLSVLTLILTVLYAHTRSIWPGVLFHGLHNAFVVTMQFFVLMD